MDRWKRLALLSGFALATTGLVAPAISAQGGRNWLGLPLGPTQLRPATAGFQSPFSRRRASPAAKLLRKQGYLVPNQALYNLGKAEAAARFGRRAPAQGTNAVRASKKTPLIASGDPDIGAAWVGQQDAGVTPPDTTGAIGTSRYIQLVNDKFGIYDRNGNVISSGGLQTFAGAFASLDVTDPQVIWDPGTNRFYFVVLDFAGFVGDGPENILWLGYSRTASPNAGGSSNWCI